VVLFIVLKDMKRKALAMKFHPNIGSDDGETMKLINKLKSK